MRQFLELVDIGVVVLIDEIVVLVASIPNQSRASCSLNEVVAELLQLKPS